MKHAAVLAISLWLGWEVARNAVADYYADSDPSTSLAWVPKHAEALVELGEAKLASGADLDAVNSAARLALQENPLQSEALVQMALVSEARHDEPRALSLMLLAEERSLRDPKVEGWLADKRLQAGDYQGAVSSLDTLLRVRPAPTKFGVSGAWRHGKRRQCRKSLSLGSASESALAVFVPDNVVAASN